MNGSLQIVMGVGYYGLSVTLFGLVSGVVLFNRSKRLKAKAEDLQDEVEGGRQLADDISAEADRQLAAYRRVHEQSLSQLQVCLNWSTAVPFNFFRRQCTP